MWRSFPYQFMFIWFWHFQGILDITEGVFPGCSYISEWSTCTSSCGTGMRMRALNCTQNKGTWYKMKKCINYHVDCYIKKKSQPMGLGIEKGKSSTQRAKCVGNSCAGHWTDWTRCSAKCGDGIQTRTWVHDITVGDENVPVFNKRYCTHWGQLCGVPPNKRPKLVNVTPKTFLVVNMSRDLKLGIIIGSAALVLIAVIIASLVLRFR